MGRKTRNRIGAITDDVAIKIITGGNQKLFYLIQVMKTLSLIYRFGKATKRPIETTGVAVIVSEEIKNYNSKYVYSVDIVEPNGTNKIKYNQI